MMKVILFLLLLSLFEILANDDIVKVEENVDIEKTIQPIIDQTSDISSDFKNTTETISIDGVNITNEEVGSDEDTIDNIRAEENSTAKVKISKQVVCNETGVEDIANVEVINATQILKLLHVDLNITDKATAANCHLVYFYSPYCAFSVKGSPYVNALARSIKNIPVYGLDSIEHHNLNSRYGVAGTPSLVLFHNGLIVGRYNASEFTTSNLMAFVHHYTDQKIENINVTSTDFRANIPSEIVYTTPYVIYLSWILLIGDAIWYFMKSRLYARITEIFVNNWREAEAQHEHED